MSLVFRLLLFSPLFLFFLLNLPPCLSNQNHSAHDRIFNHVTERIILFFFFFRTTLPIMILYGKKALMVTSVSQTGNFWWSASHKLFTPSPTKISASPRPDIVPRPLLPTLQSFHCGFFKLDMTPRVEWSSLTFSCEHSAVLGGLHHAETGAAYCDRTALFWLFWLQRRDCGDWVAFGQMTKTS